MRLHDNQDASYVLYDPEAPVITPRKPKRDCTKIVLTDDQQQWLRDNYATTLNKDCSAHLGISESSVHRWARQLGLTKDPDWFHALVMERVRMMAAVNPDQVIPQWQKDLAAWVNKRAHFVAHSFADFRPRKGFTCNHYLQTLY